MIKHTRCRAIGELRFVHLLFMPLISHCTSFIVSGIPLPPAIKNKDTELPTCHVNVSWSAPVDNGCPPTKYSVYYRQIHSQETEVEVKVPDVLKTHYVLLLKCNTQYMIEVSAWNEELQSERSRKWITTTMSG